MSEEETLTFVNYNPSTTCGCKVKYSDGEGMYSDVITVILCEKHRSKQ